MICYKICSLPDNTPFNSLTLALQLCKVELNKCGNTKIRDACARCFCADLKIIERKKIQKEIHFNSPRISFSIGINYKINYKNNRAKSTEVRQPLCSPLAWRTRRLFHGGKTQSFSSYSKTADF